LRTPIRSGIYGTDGGPLTSLSEPMMLFNCHECGHQVSDQARACPSCGARIASSKTSRRWFPSPILGFFVVLCGGMAFMALRARDGGLPAAANLAVGERCVVDSPDLKNVVVARDDSYEQAISAIEKGNARLLASLSLEDKVRLLPPGSQADVTEAAISTVKIRLPDGWEGWIGREFVRRP
jgi:hypothetical protein